MDNQPQSPFAERTEKSVRLILRSLVLMSLGMTACGVVHQTAVGTYQVATAPFRLFQRSSPTPAPTPVPPPPPSPPPAPPHKAIHRSSPHPKSSPSPSAKRKAQDGARPSPTPAKKSAASSSQRPAQSPVFPTAKPVPDKPGYVYSPSQPTKYVDVSGYTPGSKVKDPYSGQIFIVP